MHFIRDTHSATTLLDGRVLVAGGGTGSVLAAQSEVFSPNGEHWTEVAALSQGRVQHTATLLTDGTVLAAGGATYNTILASAERYLPATDEWIPAGTLSIPRMNHAAVRLTNGNVLVIGGTSRNTSGQDVTTATSEIYSTASNSWLTTSSMAVARQTPQAVLLPSGKVLVCGGLTGASMGGYAVLQSVELYDPSTNQWEVVSPMMSPRNAHTATLMPNGTVVVVGGLVDTAGSALATVEAYDPADDTWFPLPSIQYARYQHLAVLAGDTLLVVAGVTFAGPLSEAEQFSLSANSWSPAGDGVVDRYNHAAALLAGGRVLVSGGDALIGGTIGRTGHAEISGVGADVLKDSFE